MEEFVMRKLRSHGEIINASFSFVRLHARMIATSLLQLVMPLLLFVCGILILSYLAYSDLFTADSGSTDESVSRAFGVGMAVLLLLFVMAVAFALANSIYYAIVKLAIQHGTDYTVQQVRGVVKKVFWSMVGMYIFQMILNVIARWALQIPLSLIGVGFLSNDLGLELIFFSTILGVALQIAVVSYFSVAFSVMVIENGPVYSSLTRSVKLVRGHFWKSLGLQMSMGVIVYCMMAAPMTHPVLLYQLLRQLLDPVALSKWFLESPVVSSLAIAVYLLFCLSALFFIWVLFAVSQSLLYTDLVERREGVGLALRLHRSISPAPEPEPEPAPAPAQEAEPDSNSSSAPYTVGANEEQAEPIHHEPVADQSVESVQESKQHVQSSETSSDQQAGMDQGQTHSVTSQDDSPQPEAASQPSDSSTTEEAL